MADAHNLGDDGQAGSFLGFFEELEALCLKALERIRRGAGLECAAAQERSACGLDALCDTADLRFAFDGARTRDERKGTVADHLTGRKLDDRIFRMELTVCFFIRLLHALDAFYNILCGDVLAVYRSGIADKAEHGGMCADPCVNTDVITVGEIRNEVFDLFFTAVGFEYDDHVFSLTFLL